MLITHSFPKDTAVVYKRPVIKMETVTSPPLFVHETTCVTFIRSMFALLNSEYQDVCFATCFV
jgi:hypothetical protein